MVFTSLTHAPPRWVTGTSLEEYLSPIRLLHTKRHQKLCIERCKSRYVCHLLQTQQKASLPMMDVKFFSLEGMMSHHMCSEALQTSMCA